MPKLSKIWTRDKLEVTQLGIQRVLEFCQLNSIDCPQVEIIAKSDWKVNACAYYREKYGIVVCVDYCQTPCPELNSRNWSWPGYIVDRTPYGVIAHELGHHCDVLESRRQRLSEYSYSGGFSRKVRSTTNESEITTYCPNDAEWFAEIFRLFVTNPELLRLLRPKTFVELTKSWTPIAASDWKFELGNNVPSRIIKAARNKIKTNNPRSND